MRSPVSTYPNQTIIITPIEQRDAYPLIGLPWEIEYGINSNISDNYEKV